MATAQATNVAENYERYFVPVIGGPFAEDLVREADLQPGERVLDVACGTGVVARLAAQRVAPDGSVAGVDSDAGMLDLARSISAAWPIKWYESSAESMPLPDASFDVAFCHLALQFFQDKAAALRELSRVLVAGGRVYLHTPRPNRFLSVFDDGFQHHISDEAAGLMRTVTSYGDPQVVHEALRAAGFADVHVRIRRRTIQLPAARDFLWQYISSTPLLPLVDGADLETRQALEQEVVKGWQAYRTGEGMTYEQEVLVATARKP